MELWPTQRGPQPLTNTEGTKVPPVGALGQSGSAFPHLFVDLTLLPASLSSRPDRPDLFLLHLNEPSPPNPASSPFSASTEFLPLACLHNTTINTNTTDTLLHITVVSYASDQTLTAIANSSHHTS
ncbi:hypothetical protein FALCPG4_008996 [Fusarium falciforme]